MLVILLDISTMRMGAGCVLHGVEGDVFISSALPMQGIHTTNTDMIRAIYISIILSIEIGFSCLVIEMGSNLVCEFLKEDKRCLASEGGLIDDIYYVARSLEYCEWAICSKSFNKVIYTLVSIPVNAQKERIWLRNFLHSLSDSVILGKSIEA